MVHVIYSEGLSKSIEHLQYKHAEEEEDSVLKA